MLVRQVVFQFKGTRNYIHGSDIFNLMTEGYPAAAMSNIRFTIHDLIHTPQCRLYLADSKEELNTASDIRARCLFIADGAPRWLALAPDDCDASSGGRYEYDEDKVVSLCSMEGKSITLTTPSPFTFIETVVAMCKHMHQQIFLDASGKWFFTRLDLTNGCDAREQIELRLRHNMDYRLTKSDILVSGNKVGDLFFSLVKL